MNKVVRRHFPASKLPVELRGDIPASAHVRVVVEEDDLANAPTSAEIRAMRDSLPAATDDPSERIGRLRDERD
jgi:hypothetical protein